MASGRINRNGLPSKGEGRRVTQSTYVSTVFVALVSYWCVCSATPIGCHRTTEAHIRFHLYGGPQG